MDRIAIPIKQVGSSQESRSCAKCHYSWVLQPTNKELKNGIVDGLMYCCEVRARLKMPDGQYPRLAIVTREDNQLCGTKGKWWEPAREMPAGAITSPTAGSGFQRQPRRDRPIPGASQFGRPNKVPGQAGKSGVVGTETVTPSRKPYKVA